MNGVIAQPLDSLVNLSIGTYNLNVVDANGCIYNQSESLVMTTGESVIRIPNVLTANGDETNDIWKIYTDCVEGVKCEIFNRWGNIVYQKDNYINNWHGENTDGQELPDATYFAILEINNGDIVLKGYVEIRKK